MIESPHREAPAIPTVTSTTFREFVLDSNEPVAVEFMSYGCAHCRTIEPLLQQAARAIATVEKVYRVNVAVQPQLASDWNIEGTPTLVMFRAGSEVGRVEGPSPTLASVTATLTAPFRS